MTQQFSGAAAISVTHEVVARVVVADEPPLSMPVSLRYDRSDPYAVCLSVGAAPRAVDWVFARSLLAAGLLRPTGLGNVLVTPRCHGERDSVGIVFRSPDGEAVLSIAAPAVAAFLGQTRSVVPPGTEGRYVDLDRVVAELLAGGE
ncbi:SsgA family sporulation/cell division regulator [Kitasatospora phosalacinea]|uniref:SsgA family sporulation/cell division regulator n=1 Tax=Kitasatospora phosalacinea TaxID=2065 RepID=UPI000527BD27|nr:SsgA family sporulation/cell division regulator [Kitasatospora phosalacinea]